MPGVSAPQFQGRLCRPAPAVSQPRSLRVPPSVPPCSSALVCGPGTSQASLSIHGSQTGLDQESLEAIRLSLGIRAVLLNPFLCKTYGMSRCAVLLKDNDEERYGLTALNQIR